MNIICTNELGSENPPEDIFAENLFLANDHSSHIQLLPRPSSSSINSGVQKIYSWFLVSIYGTFSIIILSIIQ